MAMKTEASQNFIDKKEKEKNQMHKFLSKNNGIKVNIHIKHTQRSLIVAEEISCGSIQNRVKA